MKHCPYCRTDYESKKGKCPNCAAVDSHTKCDNCGNVHNAAYSPSCGFGANDTLRSCPKCGKKTKERFCPDCGHDFSGRAMQAESQNRTTTVVHVSARAEQAKALAAQKNERSKTIWTIILMVVFTPIGIGLMWMWKKNWSKTTKIVLSAIFGLFFCIGIIPAMINDSKPAIAPDGSAIPAVQEASGYLGKYNVEILSAVIQKKNSYGNDKVIIVTYGWTNNGSTDEKFANIFEEKVYQDGILCEKAYASDMEVNVDANIKPGASIYVKKAYEANGDSKNIDVEIFERYSTKTKVTRDFSKDN